MVSRSGDLAFVSISIPISFDQICAVLSTMGIASGYSLSFGPNGWLVQVKLVNIMNDIEQCIPDHL